MKKFNKKDNTLIIMCGLPASEKSTISKKISSETGIKICCMDDIREKLFKDVSCQEYGYKIFKILVKHIKFELVRGNSVIK